MIPAPFGGAWRLEIHDSLGSTSDEVLRRASDGEPGGLAVLARRQTRGRGTGGRTWSDGEGNLAISVLVRPGTAIVAPGQIGIRAAVALHQALSGAIDPSADLRIKWPNDILLDGRKLAGILSETALTADGGIDWTCIGLGANLASKPILPGVQTACLGELITPPDPIEIASILLGRLTAGLEADFMTVRSAWCERAHRIGETLHVRRRDQVIVGRFAALGAGGELLLDVGGQLVGLSDGTVTRVPAAERSTG